MLLFVADQIIRLYVTGWMAGERGRVRETERGWGEEGVGGGVRTTCANLLIHQFFLFFFFNKFCIISIITCSLSSRCQIAFYHKPKQTKAK